jgi:hypothetical protein
MRSPSKKWLFTTQIAKLTLSHLVILSFFFYTLSLWHKKHTKMHKSLYFLRKRTDEWLKNANIKL